MAAVLLLTLVWWWTRNRLHAISRQRRELELRVHERTAELEQVNQKLEAASVTDPLTGQERRYGMIMLPFSVSLFFIGALFGFAG